MKRLALLAICALMLTWMWSGLARSRDELIRMRTTAVQAWKPAEEALWHRSRILPGLAALAPKSRPAIESAMAKMAAAKDQPGFIEASVAIDEAVSKWLLEMEALPPDKVLDPLKERLHEAEFKFAQARRKYNSSVQALNIAIELFPNNLAAWAFGIRRMDNYFLTVPPLPR